MDKLEKATSNVLASTSNVASDINVIMWAQDHAMRYSDKIHDFVKDDAVAEVLNHELFDMVLRQALLFGFSVGNAYAKASDDPNGAIRLGIIKNV